ncbi:MAG TPA: PKD domain-containing protein [Chitinophagaceae bacterium]
MKNGILILLSIIFGLKGYNQNLSNRGTEFWVGYGHHQFMEPGQNNSQEMVLYFSAEPGQAANVTVTVQGRTAVQTTNYFVPAGTVIASNYMPKSGPNDCRLYDVPPTFGGNGGEGLFIMSIHIVSDVPIVAYAHTFGSASSGATMLMPVETYGYSYVSINSKQVYANNCFSWAYVVASHDNTVVEITPSVLTRLNKPAGVPFTVTLNKGQIYQVIGANPTNSSTALEVSGTKFRSIANPMGDCYPVAVFSGSSRTFNTISCGSGGGDNDNQQCFPTQAWGKRYLTAPTSRSTAANQFQTNSYKVLVKDPATIVKRNGVTLTGLQQNSFYFFESGSADLIEADKPVMVAQFMTGGGCMGGGVGDPEMMYISPIEQGIKRIGFYRNTREAITVNYLTLIIPNNGVPSLRIDGSASFDHSYAHPRLAGYTIVVKRWAPSTQSQAIVTSDSAFTAITYGLGSVESYGYNAGTMINNLNAISAIQNILDPSTPQHTYSCIGAPVKISALMAYQPTRINWSLSQLGSEIAPNADVNDMSPVLIGTVVQNGITYYKYDLAGTYTFNRADTFELPIQAYHPSIENCYQRDSLYIKIIVKAQPIAEFNFSHTGCELDTVYFNGVGTTSNSYTIRDYTWTFPGPATATGQSVKKLLPAGTHAVSLSVVTQEGCVDDTTRNITIFSRPPADFQITPASLCVGNQFTITDTSSSGIAVNQWYWDFGNAVTQTVSTGPSVTYTYPLSGTYTIKHVSKSSATCVSDTATRIVQVFAKPVIGYNFPGGCLPPSGLVQFNSTSTVPDGQPLSYAWNFGDPNANAGNPNTSTLANPTHNYAVFGTYTIQVSVTTSNGCTKDSTFTATFNLKPVLSYPSLAPVCQSESGTVSVATASVTNGVPGAGVYYGPGTSTAGDFNPSIAGAGTHTIWYKYTSNANCIDSISQTILVRAKPVASFTNAAGCLQPNGQMQFTNASTVSDAQTLSYVWNFGDATPTSTLLSPSHNYTAEGTYTVNLSATTNNGCVKDTSVAVVVSIKPQLQTNAVLTPVCEDASPFALAPIPVLNGVSGTGVYNGTGILANNMFNPLVAGDGLHTLWYVFTTTGGCKDSISTTINVHPKPTSSFGVNADICLDQSATFTDNSTISSGSISTWNWDFGDATNASYTNGNPFTKSYTNFNSYPIRLVTISNNGCKDTATRTIAVHALPVANFSLPASVCMPDGTTTFNNQTTVGDNAALNYSWDFGDGSPLSNQTNPSHVYSAINSYTVTVIAVSAFGCRDTATKVMSAFFDKPVADYTVVPTSLCQGADNNFTDLSTAPNSTVSSWNWNFGDGSSATIKNPTKRFTNAGIYDVKLTVMNAEGCASDAVTKQVTVYLQPVIDAGPSFVVPQGTIVQLRPTANDSTVVAFTWSPSTNLSDPNTLRPLVNAVSDQTYTLTANGPGGCTATDNVSVKILKPVKPPNVFSPNGDGINDKWMISNLSDYPGCYVEIFNRYGQRIFYSAGYNDPWDGTMNGKPLPVAAYYYIIVLKNGFEPIKGSITILR